MTHPPHTASDSVSLVLRLAAPLQSWGERSQFNRRQTAAEPTKSGIIGLLAAAAGRRRSEPIEDLLELCLAVRTDQPGTLLRDYHTVSDYRGGPLLSAKVNARGAQVPTAPAKATHVTQRYYLQDAVFVAAITGPLSLLESLTRAVRAPAFPLALGRRSCVPTQPLLITPSAEATAPPRLWAGDARSVLAQVPWQASAPRIAELRRMHHLSETVDLPVTSDAHAAQTDHQVDLRTDVPRSFEPSARRFTTRRVIKDWVRLPTGRPPAGDGTYQHDPFALLGW